LNSRNYWADLLAEDPKVQESAGNTESGVRCDDAESAPADGGEVDVVPADGAAAGSPETTDTVAADAAG
ncbi:MAG: hypothetical protein AB7W59_21950, partial [Acidimicrobiia bacterium]